MATKFLTISAEILQDNNLTPTLKFLLAEIQQLSTTDQGCFASNHHFSKFLNLDKRSISRYISQLKELGYINIVTVNGSRNHTRIITLRTLDKIVYPPTTELSTPPRQNCLETKENIKYNINSTTQKQKATPKRGDLQSFKEHFINSYSQQTFSTNNIGWVSSTLFKLDANNYIFNLTSQKIVPKDEAFKIWNYLYTKSIG